MEGHPQGTDIYQGLTDQELELAVRAVRQYQEARRVAVEHGQPVPEGPSITIGDVAVPVRDMAPGAVRRLFAEYLTRQQKLRDMQPHDYDPDCECPDCQEVEQLEDPGDYSIQVPDSTANLWMPWDNLQDYYNARAERMP
jgi:hypothetical protein